MRLFSVSRRVMRIEVNAVWMRFPQPDQVPISLSLGRAMKERLISLRIHLPILVLGIHIPCALMRRLFPAMFPLTLSPLALHKWPNAGILAMASCCALSLLRRLEVNQKCADFVAKLIDTVAFVAGIRYLIVPGAELNDGHLA